MAPEHWCYVRVGEGSLIAGGRLQGPGAAKQGSSAGPAKRSPGASARTEWSGDGPESPRRCPCSRGPPEDDGSWADGSDVGAPLGVCRVPECDRRSAERATRSLATQVSNQTVDVKRI